MSKVSVLVNGLTLVHRDSGATSTATLPDVCRSPPSGAPVPYPNVAYATDLAHGTSSVRIDGDQPVAVDGCVFERSSGDEAGSGGGITSGTFGAEAALLSSSFDVEIEGRGAGRLTDKMLHNRGNTIDCSGLKVKLPETKDGRRFPLKPVKPKHPSPPPKSRIPLPMPVHGVDTNLGQIIFPGKAASVHVPKPKDWPEHRAWPYYETKPATADPSVNPSPSATKPVLNAHWLVKYRQVEFVGRYLSSDSGHRWPLDREEVAHYRQAGVKIVLLWESDKFRAVSGGSTDLARQYGWQDAARAEKQIEACGQGGKDRVVYYTCDFQVRKRGGDKGLIWNRPPRGHFDKLGHKEKKAATRDLIAAYFMGIGEYYGSNTRVGCYGAYQTLHYLFEHKLITYGWQFAFPDVNTTPILPYPNGFPLGILDEPANKFEHQCHILQYYIGITSTDYPEPDLHVSGAGGLDLDAAIKVDYGGFAP